MARHTLCSFEQLWKRHELLYSEVFSAALLNLSQMNSVAGNEDAISEILNVLLTQVCFNISKLRDMEVQTPSWEAQMPPVSFDELKGGKTKKPDFTCKIVNPRAKSPEQHEMSLHVECKLLGNPTSSKWILNENYVQHGIKRFDSKIHQYGKRANSGIMIGYIISMTPKEIEAEVNGYQKKHLQKSVKIQFTFENTIPFHSRQVITRANVEPINFELIHLWIDLRTCYRHQESVYDNTA